MPDPFAYLLAVVTAAGLSASVAFGLARWRAPESIISALAAAAGIACGVYLLELPVTWPPSTGVGRLFSILLPAAIGIETVLALPAVPRWLPWTGRLALAVVAGRILLDGSVYIAGDRAEWSTWQAALILGGSGAALATVWLLLVALAKRSGGISIPLALTEAMVCGGLTIMLEGYVGGGEASLPIVGALAGYALVAALRRNAGHSFECVIGIGLIALFGLLFVGRFFGKLPSTSALVLFLAPLLCWTSELPVFRRLAQWQIVLLRLVAVALPLLVVVIFAKRDFDLGLRLLVFEPGFPRVPRR